MAVHQVLVGARLGDAITQIAINTRPVFETWGESHIFARHVDPTVAGIVNSIDSLPKLVSTTDIVVFHVSIGDTVVWDAVIATGARLFISYHNITPATLFAKNSEFSEMLTRGREQLVNHADKIDTIFTESEFNRSDLREMGFDEVTLLAATVDPFRLSSIHSDPGFGTEVHRRSPGPMILFVGQMLPHKRPQMLVSALHLLASHHRPDATLVLAGHHPIAQFAQQIAQFTESLGLADRVWMTGGIDDAQLGELYRNADVMATASLHEGLCVPALEAMAMSVPVVASPHGALPETVGDCGLVVAEDSVAHYAESIRHALQPENRTSMIADGRIRARSLSLDRALHATRQFFELRI